MASPLHDNPKSPKRWKRGDRRMIDGVEMESGGALKDTKEDEKGDPPGRVLDEHIWRPVKKEVPTS